MNSPTRSLESIFTAAIQKSSKPEMLAHAAEACGNDAPLLAQVDRLIQAHCHSAESFMESPASGLNSQLDQLAQTVDFKPEALDAGFAAAFSVDASVVMGSAGHSVIESLSKKLRSQPEITLRNSPGERTPAQKPNSPEIPRTETDSRYQLHGEIARGGMGAVLKGRDVDLGRDLAIKVLLDRHKDHPEHIERFIEEAQIGGQLQHPGIAPVYELGQFADERPFFTMKLVKGETLAAILAKRTSPQNDLTRLIGIFEQVCQTMAYAHSKGVIHRDLKPANVMVGAFGEVQVMDWGLAKVLSAGGVADEKLSQRKQTDQSIIQTRRSPGSHTPDFGSAGSHTQMGSVMGTPAYMPPEQALGEIDTMDERADVFGLGAVLCEILTGKPPYTASNTDEIFKLASRGKLDDCLDRLAACDADAELVHLVKECLHVDPDHRPADAGVLAERLSSYLQSVDVRLREAELDRAAQAARVVEERKRRKVTMALAASLLLIVGLGSTAWIHNERQTALHDRERVERQLAAEKDVREDLFAVENLLASVASVGIGDTDLTEQESLLSRQLDELKDAVSSATQANESAQQEDVGDQLRIETDEKFAEVDQLLTECKAELERVKSLRELRDDLEKIRLSLAGQGSKTATNGKNYFASEMVNAKYELAFKGAELDLFQKKADDIHSIIQDSPIREELIASLDQWARAISHLSPNDDSQMSSAPKLLHRLNVVATVADRADANEWRKRVRHSLLSIARVAMAAPEHDETKRHIALLRELALSDEARQQPPELIAWFGSTLRDAGEQDAATTMLRNAQQDNPSSFWLNFELGKSLSNLGESNQAVEYLRAALAVRSDSLEVLSNLSIALREAGRNDESLHFRKAMIPLISQEESNRKVLQQIFRKLRREGRVPGMIAAQRSLCDADPEDADAWILLLRLFLASGNREERLPVLQRVADLEPVDPERFVWIVHSVGDYFCEGGRFDEAIQAYHIAIQFAPPDDGSAQRKILSIYALLERWKEGADFGRQWVEVKPDDSSRWLVVAPTLFLGSDQATYKTHCNDMLERFNGSMAPGDAINVCKACCLSPDFVEPTRLPLATLVQALESEPPDESFAAGEWNTRALVALRSDRAEEAIEFVLKSEDSSPSPSAHALNFAINALAKAELGKISSALADFGKGSQALAALQTRFNPLPSHEQLIAEIILREAKDSLDRLLPEGLRSFTQELPEMDPRDHLELLLQFELWDEAAPIACQISENLSTGNLPTGNWRSVRSLFLKRLTAIEPLFHAMIASSSNASEIWLARARRLALRSDWQAAADAYLHSTELGITDSEVWFETASAMRLCGNEKGYRKLVSKLLEQWEEHPGQHDGLVFSRTIGLAHQTKQIARKALRSAQADFDVEKYVWDMSWLGLAQFRAGDYQQAQLTVETSMGAQGEKGQITATLAMINSKLQQHDAAQALLSAAKNTRQNQLDASTNFAVYGRPNVWLGINALIAEAERTLSENSNEAQSEQSTD